MEDEETEAQRSYVIPLDYIIQPKGKTESYVNHVFSLPPGRNYAETFPKVVMSTLL